MFSGSLLLFFVLNSPVIINAAEEILGLTIAISRGPGKVSHNKLSDSFIIDQRVDYGIKWQNSQCKLSAPS